MSFSNMFNIIHLPIAQWISPVSSDATPCIWWVYSRRRPRWSKEFGPGDPMIDVVISYSNSIVWYCSGTSIAFYSYIDLMILQCVSKNLRFFGDLWFCLKNLCRTSISSASWFCSNHPLSLWRSMWRVVFWVGHPIHKPKTFPGLWYESLVINMGLSENRVYSQL